MTSDAQAWATPVASDGKRGTSPYSAAEINRPQGKPMTLAKDAAMWPTPMSKDHKSGSVSEATSERNSRTLNEAVLSALRDQPPNGAESSRTCGRRLNPAFVCWLMGAPWWWTRAEPISFAARETDAYRLKLRSLLSSLCGE